MATPATCPRCSAPAPLGASFCPHCAFTLAPAAGTTSADGAPGLPAPPSANPPPGAPGAGAPGPGSPWVPPSPPIPGSSQQLGTPAWVQPGAPGDAGGAGPPGVGQGGGGGFPPGAGSPLGSNRWPVPPPAPAKRSRTGLVIALVAIGLVAVVLVPILAVTFLGRSSSQKFERVGTPIGPSSGSRTPTGSPEGEPALGTHWHSAYGIYICDDFIEPLYDDGDDVHGIHTHGDGLIHIHPFDTTVTGERATLGAFTDQVGIDALPGGGIRLPDGTEITTCDGEPVGLMLLRWDPDRNGAWPDLEFADFEALGFEQDHEIITIAVVSRNQLIDGDFYDEVFPPSAELLTEYGAAPIEPSTSTTERSTTTTEPPQPSSPIGALWLIGAQMDEVPAFGPGDESPTMARIEELTGTSPGTLEPLAGLVPDRATAVFEGFPDLGPTQVITMRAATPEDAQAFLAELRNQHADELTDLSTYPDFQTEPWEGLGADYTWTTPDGRTRVTSAGIIGTDIVITIAGDIEPDEAVLATTFAMRTLTGTHR